MKLLPWFETDASPGGRKRETLVGLRLSVTWLEWRAGWRSARSWLSRRWPWSSSRNSPSAEVSPPDRNAHPDPEPTLAKAGDAEGGTEETKAGNF